MASIALCGCDKTIPGRHGYARLDLPGLVLYGGSIARSLPGTDVTIQDVFEAIGAFAAGKMTDAELKDLEISRARAPAHVAGSSPLTPWRWPSSFLASPDGQRIGAGDDGQSRFGSRCGWTRYGPGEGQPDAEVHYHPRVAGECDYRRATSGGTTNGVLHLLAIAREAGLPLTIDDFDAISRKARTLCDLKPGGRFVATDLHRAGGFRLVARRLLEGGCCTRTSPRRPAKLFATRRPPSRNARPGGRSAVGSADQVQRRPASSRAIWPGRRRG